MAEKFLEMEKGGWLNARFVIGIEPAANMGFVAKYQVGSAVDSVRLDPTSVELFLKDAAVTDVDE